MPYPSPDHYSVHRPGIHAARGGGLHQEQEKPLGGAHVGPSTSVSQRRGFGPIWRWTTGVRTVVH